METPVTMTPEMSALEFFNRLDIPPSRGCWTSPVAPAS